MRQLPQIALPFNRLCLSLLNGSGNFYCSNFTSAPYKLTHLLTHSHSNAIFMQYFRRSWTRQIWGNCTLGKCITIFAERQSQRKTSTDWTSTNYTRKACKLNNFPFHEISFQDFIIVFYCGIWLLLNSWAEWNKYGGNYKMPCLYCWLTHRAHKHTSTQATRQLELRVEYTHNFTRSSWNVKRI